MVTYDAILGEDLQSKNGLNNSFSWYIVVISGVGFLSVGNSSVTEVDLNLYLGWAFCIL